jgi:hypothetical protein
MHFDFSLHVSVPARIRAKPLIAGWPGGGKTNSTERNSRQGFTDFWREQPIAPAIRYVGPKRLCGKRGADCGRRIGNDKSASGRPPSGWRVAPAKETDTAGTARGLVLQ